MCLLFEIYYGMYSLWIVKHGSSRKVCVVHELTANKETLPIQDYTVVLLRTVNFLQKVHDYLERELKAAGEIEAAAYDTVCTACVGVLQDKYCSDTFIQQVCQYMFAYTSVYHASAI